ncbi:MAG: ABC transporter ATP-binding protein [Pseudomonadota bacterium]
MGEQLRVEGVWKRFGRSMPASRRLIAAEFLDCLGAPRRAARLRGDAPGEDPRVLGSRVQIGNEAGAERGIFWALRDVEFSVREGESVALLGLNGAGKTTLLNLVAGLGLPDRGRIVTQGRIGAMIGLASGLNPRLTGRENAELNLSVLGVAQGRAMTEALERVIDFTELTEVIDAPIATYSAGMRMRLAFAVAAHGEAPLMLIDEILAVGDYRFRQKCLALLSARRGRTTFFLVSHAITDVERFCDRALLLEAGRLVFDGAVTAGVERYERAVEIGSGIGETGAQAADRPEGPARFRGPAVRMQNRVGAVAARLISGAGAERTAGQLAPYGAATVEINFELTGPVRLLHLAVPIWDEQGRRLIGLSSEIAHGGWRDVAPGSYRARLDVPMLGLASGTFATGIVLHDAGEVLYRQPGPCFEIAATGRTSFGTVSLPHDWTLDQLT